MLPILSFVKLWKFMHINYLQQTVMLRHLFYKLNFCDLNHCNCDLCHLWDVTSLLLKLMYVCEILYQIVYPIIAQHNFCGIQI